jgi:hypothetical protein
MNKKRKVVMEKNENGLTEYTTPSSYVFGWLCIAFGIIPLLEGMNSKNKITLYIGLGLETVGIILLMVGKFQANALAKKISEKSRDVHGDDRNILKKEMKER